MFTVYSASAGSGKTYNLVLDYLAACFKPHLGAFQRAAGRKFFVCPSCTEYQRILAITFTNNAAAEMKERVVNQLNTLAFAKSEQELPQHDFQNLCRKVFGDNHGFTQEECFHFIHETSKTLLHSILYDYAQFSITTIDSFIQRIIRSSALFLNLSMNYAVQIRLTDFFRAAIERYLCELPQSGRQLEVTVKELLQQLEEKGSANIRRFLSKGLGILYYDAEKSHPHLRSFPDEVDLSEITEMWKKKQHEAVAACTRDVVPFSKKALSIIQDAASEGFPANQKMKWDQWFAHIADDPFNLGKGFEKSRCHQEMNTGMVFSDPKKCGKSEKEARKARKEEFALQLREVFDQTRGVVLKYAKKFLTYRILARNANSLLVLGALRYHVENIKEQTNSFFLSESNPLLSDKIEEGSGDNLFEKTGGYRNIFIDEFQDTSLMQWFDLKPLIINAMSDNGSVTLFGDVKQSIYRFRNGEVSLFYNLLDYDRMQNGGNQDLKSMTGGKEGFNFKPLKTNYRSQSSVIEFNNRFFSHYAQSLGWEDYYEDVEQGTTPKKSGGLVQIYGYDKKKRKDLRAVWKDCGDDFYENTYLTMEPAAAELLYAVMDAKSRGYAYRDITVLLSGRGKCNDFAQSLLLAGIPVVTSESLQLCDNPNVNLIISTLRLLVNPKDSMAKAAILQYFARQSSSGSPGIFGMDLTERFSDMLSERFEVKDFESRMEVWRRNPFLMSLKEMVQFYGFSQETDPFVADFLDRAYEYTLTQVASVPNFLSWWDDLNRYSETIPRLSLEGSSDAVRLMTIHGSKGLEFPVVITQCTTSNRNDTYYWVKDPGNGQSCYVRHEKDMQYSAFKGYFEDEERKRELDSLNLWYVDFTRARDMLYIISESADSEEGDESETDLKKNIPKEESPEKRKDVKSLLMEYAKNMDKQGLICYYGNFGWRNPEPTEVMETKGSPFRVTCSDLKLCGNKAITVVASAESSESQDTGTHIHDFLQKLTHFPRTEEERVKAVSGEPEEIRERLLQLFEKTFADTALRPYFYPDEADRVLNEVAIITGKGEIRRPDRVVFKSGHVMIIDYKTGRDYKTKYEAQLAEYRECIEKMGYSDVRTEILYID